MKVVVSSLVVVFAALLIALVSSSDVKKVQCEKLDGCKTQNDEKEDKSKTLVDCHECAAWGCYYDNIFYYGSGCNGDENICKIGNNQNVPEYDDVISFFHFCNSRKQCAVDKLDKKKAALDRDPQQLSALTKENCDPTHSRSENGPLVCEKQNKCERNSSLAGILAVVHCEECAGWSCILNNTLYTGYGCKGDNNICKVENNQNESEKYEDSSWFVSCNNSDRCAFVKLSEFMIKENGTFSKDAYKHVGDCNPKALRCEKSNNCLTTKGYFGGEMTHVDCDECAAWACFKDGVSYNGLGCKGDNNVCKVGNNQNGSEYHHKGEFFVACDDHMCAFTKIRDLAIKYKPDMPSFSWGTCNPNKDGTKIGALTIGGMILLAWMFGRY